MNRFWMDECDTCGGSGGGIDPSTKCFACQGSGLMESKEDQDESGGATMSDSIIQALDEMQDRCGAATPGPWTATYDDADKWTCITGRGRDLGGGLWMVCPEVATCEGEPDGDAEFIAASRTSLPATVAALKAVLELHRPVDVEPSDTICGECSFQLPNGRYFGKIVEWPCPTVATIEAAFADEVSGDE